VSDIEYGARLKIAEIKASGDAFEVAGYVSTYGNVDHGGDVVMRGAFDTTLAAKTPVRFLAHHDTHQVLGVPLEMKSDDQGLFGRFKISQTQLGRDMHTLLKDGALDSFSIGYIPTDVEFDDAGTRLLKSVDLLECSIVAMPMNTRATVTAVKGDEHKATWSTSYINNLPDSAFAAIESGGKKDSEGKTTPRSLRHYPHHDASGKLDEPHLNAALSRIGDKSNFQGGKSHLMHHKNASKVADWFGELDEDVPFEELLAQVGDYVNIAAEAAEALQKRRVESERLADAHIEAIHELLEVAEAACDRLDDIANPPAPADERLRKALAEAVQRGNRYLETT